jgi:hypothetical protein
MGARQAELMAQLMAAMAGSGGMPPPEAMAAAAHAVGMGPGCSGAPRTREQARGSVLV